MGEIKVPEKVMLFCGFLYSDRASFDEARQTLIREYGNTVLESATIDFTFTNYYDHEMGPGIQRCFIAFEDLIEATRLPSVKIRTNAIEERFAQDGQRRVNLDPGYLNLSKVVLASTKDYSHRLLLNEGIFGEITLNWQNKHYVDLPWTYPDYKSDFAKEYFTRLREEYRNRY